MKNIYLILFIAASLFAMQSCTKQVIEPEKIRQLTIDTAIAMQQTFNVDLSAVYAPRKKVVIIQQAKYFQTSKIDSVQDTNLPYYTYTSKQTRGVTDKIVLAVTDRCQGATIDSTIIYINVRIK